VTKLISSSNAIEWRDTRGELHHLYPISIIKRAELLDLLKDIFLEIECFSKDNQQVSFLTCYNNSDRIKFLVKKVFSLFSIDLEIVSLKTIEEFFFPTDIKVNKHGFLVRLNFTEEELALSLIEADRNKEIDEETILHKLIAELSTVIGSLPETLEVVNDLSAIDLQKLVTELMGRYSNSYEFSATKHKNNIKDKGGKYV